MKNVNEEINDKVKKYQSVRKNKEGRRIRGARKLVGNLESADSPNDLWKPKNYHIRRSMRKSNRVEGLQGGK